MLAAIFACGARESLAQTCVEPNSASQFAVDNLVTDNTLNAGEYVANIYHQGATQAAGPVQIAVAPNGTVFIAKMQTGQVRVYKASNPNTTTLAGTVPTIFNNEDGLLGIVLAPDFAASRWVYVFHTDSASARKYLDNSNTANPAQTGNYDKDVRMHTLTRYTYDSNAAAGSQLTNPKTILRFNRILDERPYHAAGGLDITSTGILVIGTGDDTSPHSGECSSNNAAPLLWNNRGCDAQKSSSNTNDLRGKMLRIKPIAFADNLSPAPGIGSTYDIPAGNLWEKISDPAFNPNWNPASDTLAKVRQEIYTMGHRNPYHPRIDTKTGWIFAGEIGLDAGSPTAYTPSRGPEGREEWNLATGPGFYGHPYCVGNNTPWRRYTSPATTWTTTGVDTFYNCAAVQNVSPNNTGIRNLPPAKPATLWYSNNNQADDGARLGIPGGVGGVSVAGETSISGPMYRYDTALSSAGGKFPPFYEGKVFYFDWAVVNTATTGAAGTLGRNPSLRVIAPSPNGTVPADTAGVRDFPGRTVLPSGSFIDMRFGPHDGAMYLLKFSNNGYAANQTGLYRVRYTGTYDNACYRQFTATVGPGVSLNREVIRKAMAPVLANGMVTLPVGYRGVGLYDLSGRRVWSHSRTESARAETFRVPSGLAMGVLHARLTP